MLRTLNGLSLHDFQQIKPLLALLYVTLEGQTPRRQLAELLWPAARQPDSSLRVALHALRELNATLIESEDPLQSSVRCDAQELLNLRGQAALDAYAGPFLHGVNLRGVSAEFQEWVLNQRERLAQHVQSEALTFAERTDPARAALLAEQVYRLPGAPPAAPELLRRLLPLSLPGSPLEQAICQELEDVGGTDTPPTRFTSARLLGRAAEFDALLAWALQPGGGLAGISGPGGVGKSTLGREVLRELHRLNHDTLLVDAEGVQYGPELLARLAHARAQARGAGAVPDTWAGVQPLMPGGLVVLLDGLDALEQRQRFLQEARTTLPGVRWLLTSRRNPLPPARPDQPHPLDGLSMRLSGLDTPAIEADWTETKDSAATQLFVREARRVQRTFSITPENAPLVAAITRRLEGHPLSVTLAASWLRIEPLQGVHDRVLEQASTLQDATGDTVRSLSAVATYSWNLLSASQQRSLLRLSTFADFEPPDALALGVPEEDLNALLEHAFLEAYRPGSERLRLYPALTSVITTYGPAHPDLLREARTTHAHHYLTWLLSQPPTSPRIADELGNLHRAIPTALENGSLTPQVFNHLLSHYDTQAKAESGTDAFQDWSDQAEDARSPDDVQAAAQIACMWLASRADRLLDAQTLATNFLQSHLAENPAHRMKALNTLASVRKEQGQYRVSAELLDKAYQLALESQDVVRQGMYLVNGIAAWLQAGELTEVEARLSKAQQLAEQLDQVMLLVNLYWVKLELNQPDYSALLIEGRYLLDRAIQSGHKLATIAVAHYLAINYIETDQPRKALKILKDAEGHFGDSENKGEVTLTSFTKARIFYQLGRASQARTCVKNGLQIAVQKANNPDLITGLLIIIEEARQKHPKETDLFLRSAMNSSWISVKVRKQICNLLGDDHQDQELALNAQILPIDFARQILEWL